LQLSRRCQLVEALTVLKRVQAFILDLQLKWVLKQRGIVKDVY
jgi:hypothetical protein